MWSMVDLTDIFSSANDTFGFAKRDIYNNRTPKRSNSGRKSFMSVYILLQKCSCLAIHINAHAENDTFDSQ